jgi:hypothetical protein
MPKIGKGRALIGVTIPKAVMNLIKERAKLLNIPPSRYDRHVIESWAKTSPPVAPNEEVLLDHFRRHPTT